jgi:hypothetical protein
MLPGKSRTMTVSRGLLDELLKGLREAAEDRLSEQPVEPVDGVLAGA